MSSAIVAASSNTSAVQKFVPNAVYASKRLITSFKKAAWIASTSVLILLVPLIIEMDRESQIIEMEKDQVGWTRGGWGLSCDDAEA